MDKKNTIDNNTELRLHEIADALAAPFSANAQSVRRLHELAREITSLADSIGRHERVDFAETWPESLDPKEAQRMQLPLYLGMTSQDEKLVIDLARLPHLLVGGASGQGKSNMLNCIISGLARLLPPEQLRFVLFDPKCVEFLQYSALPHLAFPVITDGAKFVYVLRWLVCEMDKRLKEFARVTCRNIEDFRKAGNQMPYLVVIIDEIVDLIQNFGKEVEPLIARLTALARAAGIHLVVATQVADHKVLSATLRCNIPGRISFKTRNGSESKIIIDAPDADVLCAPGDMLVRQKDGTLARAQCAYLSGEEEARIIEAVEKRHGSPKFLALLPDVVFHAAPEPQPDTTGPSEEEMYARALEVVRTTNHASTSHLQRKMGIGYNHAARLIDLMEERGVIGPQVGAQPREILVLPQ